MPLLILYRFLAHLGPVLALFSSSWTYLGWSWASLEKTEDEKEECTSMKRKEEEEEEQEEGEEEEQEEEHEEEDEE